MELPKHLIERRDTVLLAIDQRANELQANYDTMLKAMTAFNNSVQFYNRALAHAAGYRDEAVAVMAHMVDPAEIKFSERAMIAEYQGTYFRLADLFQIMPIRPRTDHWATLRDLPTIC